MQIHRAILPLTSRERMLQSIHAINGGAMSMNAIASALERIQTEIQRVRDYLTQLEETEREMVKLVTARQRMLGDLPIEEAPPTNETSQQPLEETPTLPQSLPPLPFDILKVLSTAGRTMSFTQIQQDVERIRGPVKKNALSSTLSRLVQERRIRRPKPGRYAVVTPKNVSEEAATLREDSIPSLAYTILREAGKPLTDDEIYSLAKAVKPDIKRHSVTGSLYANAKIGRLFKLIREKTFSLLEWQNQRGNHQQALADGEMEQSVEGLRGGESLEGVSATGDHNLSYQAQ